MTYVFAALAGAAGAALGGVLFALLGTLVGGLLRISNFEGARGYFAVWVFGPIGVLLGLAVGLYLVFRYHGGYVGFGEIAWRGAAVVAGLLGIVGAGAALRLATQPDLTRNAPPPQFLFEIRMPADAPLPAARADIRVHLQTYDTDHSALLEDDSPKLQGETKIVAGLIQMYRRTASRTVVLRLADGRDVVFVPRIPATPRHAAEYGPWEPARHLYEKGGQGARAPKPEERFEIRYRVDWEHRS
jgi:MFS family permease